MITKIDLKLDFVVTDTTALCTPASYTFIAKGQHVERYKWDFGDELEVNTHEEVMRKIYDLSRAPIGKNKFDVKLTAFHISGCTQNKKYKELIRIKGPQIKFSIPNGVGCSPLTVQFENYSSGYDMLSFDFGDNTSVTEDPIDTHTYFGVEGLPFTVYRPYVLADDGKGCKVSLKLDDSVLVFQVPKIKEQIISANACTPMRVSFNDLTPYIYKRTWRIFNANNKEIHSETKKSWSKMFDEGAYSISLNVEIAEGCKDSIYFPNHIIVSPPPKLSIKFEDTLACINTPFEIIGSADDETAILDWWWGITQFFAETLVSGKELAHEFKHPGKVGLTLYVKDIKGCITSLDTGKVIEVISAGIHQKPKIYFTDHLNNNQVEINFSQGNRTYTRSHQLFQVGESQDLFYSKNLYDTVFQHEINFENQPLCYYMTLNDLCEVSFVSDTHCTVALSVDSQITNRTVLLWTAYKGWPLVLHYYIYRKPIDENKMWQAIGRVSGSQLTFTDSSFCDSTYSYKVEAVNFSGIYYSNSNRLKHKSDYTFQDEPLLLKTATVAHNKMVLSNWYSSIQLGKVSYQIDRKPVGERWTENWQQTKDTFYNDESAKVAQKPYSYRVRVKDQCENISIKSNLGRSIYLDVSQRKQETVLKWNAYLDWPKGVASYLVQRKKSESNLFETIEVLKDSGYLDMEAYFLFDSHFKYRIVAIENASIPDSSFSNEVEIAPIPSLYVPNAFTPNGDGLNDVFNLSAWALESGNIVNGSFSLQIYNRWGQLIFNTHDINEGWDGNFKGAPSQDDVYMWLITAKGLNGTLYYLDGNVTLIR